MRFSSVNRSFFSVRQPNLGQHNLVNCHYYASNLQIRQKIDITKKHRCKQFASLKNINFVAGLTYLLASIIIEVYG